MSESSLVKLMQSVGVVHECLNAFFYIYPMDWTRHRKARVSCHNPGSNKVFCWKVASQGRLYLESYESCNFASCIVAGKKQCVNIIKKKITWSIFETVIILLACVSVTILCLIKRVFSTPAARSEFDRRICLIRDERTKAGHRSMAQSIPSVHIPLRAFVGHLSFCFGKAANGPPGKSRKLHFPVNTIFIGSL